MKILTLVLFSFIFVQAGKVDLYLALEEKARLEYINKVTKLSLRGISNTMINNLNIATYRNTRLSDILATSNTLGIRDKEIINTMEEISIDLLNNNISINCISIVDSTLNTIGIVYDECFELDRKLSTFYEIGVFSVQRFTDGALEYKNLSATLKQDEFNDNMLFFNKLNNIKQGDNDLIRQISVMNGTYLGNLCDKITDANNKTFLSKIDISNAILKRASELGAFAQISSCTAIPGYVFRAYDDTIRVYPPPTGGLIASLQAQIDLIRDQITALNTSISTAHTEYTTIFNAWNAQPPGITKILMGQEKDAKYIVWQDLLGQKTQKENTITLLENQIIALGGTPT